jgi:hypothetical protein
MKSPIPGILFALAFSVSLIMSGYFFSLTQITLNSFLTANTLSLINSIMTLNFLFFCICASIGVGLLLSIGYFYELKKAILISAPAYAISVIFLSVAFNLIDFFVPLIIGIIAIPICYLSLKKSNELKVFPIIRTGVYASNKLILIIGAAFFLVLLVISITQANYLTQNFTKDILASTVGENLTLSEQISLQLASAISAQQVSTIDLVLEQQEMKNMLASDSIDAINLNQKLLAYKQAYAGEEFKTKVSEDLKNQNIDFGSELLKSFPILNTLANYAFIIYPFSAFVLFMFIGNLLIKNIAGLIFSGIVKLIPNMENTERKA